jgi:hypothetical protein
METGGEEKGGGLTDTESRKMCVPRQESMADAIAKKRGKKKQYMRAVSSQADDTRSVSPKGMQTPG